MAKFDPEGTLRCVLHGEVLCTYCAPPLPKPDMVNAPSHYTRLTPEPIELIEAWGLDFFTGSAIKYIARAGHKPGQDAVLDLQKAVSFLGRKIQSLQGKPVVVR